MTKKNLFLLVPALLMASAMASGCSPTVANRGNMVKDYQMVTINPGVSTKSDVLRAMGSPTTQDPFDENKWFYIGQVTEKNGVLDPKITDERIVMVDFDDTGIVEIIKDVGGQREDIPFERRKTATSGNEVTIMQQFFGNLGKFNGAGEQKGSK